MASETPINVGNDNLTSGGAVTSQSPSVGLGASLTAPTPTSAKAPSSGPLPPVSQAPPAALPSSGADNTLSNVSFAPPPTSPAPSAAPGLTLNQLVAPSNAGNPTSALWSAAGTPGNFFHGLF